MSERRVTSRRWLVLLAGVMLVLFSNSTTLTVKPLSEAAADIARDLGMGLLVAAFVSIMFDLWYQKQMVGDPLGNIDTKIRDASTALSELSTTVSSLSPILKAARANGINAIYRRSSQQEIMAWQERIKTCVTRAEQYVLFAGRSLDDLFPETHTENGILETVANASQKVPMLFIFADVFDRQSSYRQEAAIRAKDNAISLYGRTRSSIKQLLDIFQESDKRKIAIRLATIGPPYALVMTEKTAIVESYLPYLQGGTGLVYEADATIEGSAIAASVHRDHQASFRELWMNSRALADGIKDFLQRKADSNDPKAERLSKYRDIATRLGHLEDSTVTLAGLF
jgi:hypothetical protein